MPCTKQISFSAYITYLALMWVCKWMHNHRIPFVIECAIIHHFDGATGIPFTPQWALNGWPERNAWRRHWCAAWQVMLVRDTYAAEYTELAHSEHTLKPQKGSWSPSNYTLQSCSKWPRQEVLAWGHLWSRWWDVQTWNCSWHYCKALQGVAFIRLQPRLYAFVNNYIEYSFIPFISIAISLALSQDSEVRVALNYNICL